jgi:hypothetical protein
VGENTDDTDLTDIKVVILIFFSILKGLIIRFDKS